MSSVLVVDSNPEQRRFVAFLLTSAGHVVRETGEVHSAVSLLRESRADLLLTDLTHANRHATETLEAIRRDFSGVEVVSLASLSYADGCLRLCAALGARRTSGKPFTHRETMAFVTEMIAGLAAHTAHARYRRERENAAAARG